MSIFRIVVVDPNPRCQSDDIIVYQVPERSRAFELLIEMLDAQGIDHVEIEPKRTRTHKRKPRCNGELAGIFCSRPLGHKGECKHENPSPVES